MERWQTWEGPTRTLTNYGSRFNYAEIQSTNQLSRMIPKLSLTLVPENVGFRSVHELLHLLSETWQAPLLWLLLQAATTHSHCSRGKAQPHCPSIIEHRTGVKSPWSLNLQSDSVLPVSLMAHSHTTQWAEQEGCYSCRRSLGHSFPVCVEPGSSKQLMKRTSEWAKQGH
jgi:hypothetical protein